LSIPALFTRWAERQQELEEELRALNAPFRTAEAFGVEDICKSK